MGSLGTGTADNYYQSIIKPLIQPSVDASSPSARKAFGQFDNNFVAGLNGVPGLTPPPKAPDMGDLLIQQARRSMYQTLMGSRQASFSAGGAAAPPKTLMGG